MGEGEGEGEGRTLVIVQYVAFMVSASIVGFSDAHRIVSEVDIAVVACTGQQFERAPSDTKELLQKSATKVSLGCFGGCKRTKTYISASCKRS